MHIDSVCVCNGFGGWLGGLGGPPPCKGRNRFPNGKRPGKFYCESVGQRLGGPANCSQQQQHMK